MGVDGVYQAMDPGLLLDGCQDRELRVLSGLVPKIFESSIWCGFINRAFGICMRQFFSYWPQFTHESFTRARRRRWNTGLTGRRPGGTSAGFLVRLDRTKTAARRPGARDDVHQLVSFRAERHPILFERLGQGADNHGNDAGELKGLVHRQMHPVDADVPRNSTEIFAPLLPPGDL